MSDAVHVTVAPDEVYLARGGWRDVMVTVQNTGSSVEHYRLDVSGIPAECYDLDPPRLTLPASASLPGTAATGSAPRFVHFMATAFPTTGAAQAAWRADTSFLGSYLEGCARRDLVAVPGRYSAYACRIGTGHKQSYITVTAVRGNVEFAFYVIVYNDHPVSLPQIQADASTKLLS